MDISEQNQIEKVANLIDKLKVSLGLLEKDADDFSGLRYVIYARKSTDTAEKQERTIGDQIGVCKQLADELGLHWVNVIHEEKSAMVSDNRELFRQMIEDVKKGKYDGIIAWAPDRLSRNMREGGEIIDLLDHGIIKDIKFGNHFIFNNNPSGKMLLGIAFIMAKQYSDQHSQDVVRANQRKTEEGKWAGSRGKHGYRKDKNHFFHPDGENHELIKDMFRLRLEGRQLKDIAAYLLERGYPVNTPHTKHRVMKIDERFVSKLLHDPIYAGVLVFKKTIINLREKYVFVPAVLPDDFEKVCALDRVNKGYSVTYLVRPEQVKANLMRQMVICGHCDHTMTAGITPKKLKAGLTNYFNFRCDTVGCKMKGKSTRAKVIREAAIEFLKNHPLASDRGYKHYLIQMEKHIVEKEKDTINKIKSFTAQKRYEDEKIVSFKELLSETKDDKVLKNEYQKDLKQHLEKSKELEKKINDLKNQKLNVKDTITTFEDFLELFKNLANSIQKIGKMSDLDFIMRKIFLNFTVTDKKVTKITQNSPFRELCLDTDSVMVTHCIEHWNTLIQQIKQWSETLPHILGERSFSFTG